MSKDRIEQLRRLENRLTCMFNDERERSRKRCEKILRVIIRTVKREDILAGTEVVKTTLRQEAKRMVKTR